MLTGTEYKPEGWKKEELYNMAQKLLGFGAKKVVISGVHMGRYIGNVIGEADKKPRIIKHEKTGDYRSGTGDIYAAIIAADSINRVDFESSVRKAAGFVKKAVAATERLKIPSTDGLAFEEVLYTLKRD